jgi:uncharacterized DUF497 family protein
MDKTQFDWDAAKDRQNQLKHGVPFALAQYAFADPKRVVLLDLEHSDQEQRFYCIGNVGAGIMTVRFTYRGKVIRIIGAGYWRKGKSGMKSKINYTNEPMGKVRVVKDFLPSPDQLAFKEEKVKVTISLSRTSLDFFKAQANRHHTAYQKMIRNLLDAYAAQHMK